MNIRGFVMAVARHVSSMLSDDIAMAEVEQRSTLLLPSVSLPDMRRALTGAILTIEPPEEFLPDLLSSAVSISARDIAALLLRTAWLKNGGLLENGQPAVGVQTVLRIFRLYLDVLCLSAAPLSAPIHVPPTERESIDESIVKEWGRHMLMADNISYVQKTLRGLDQEDRQRRIEMIAAIMLGHEVNSTVEFEAVVDECLDEPKVLN